MPQYQFRHAKFLKRLLKSSKLSGKKSKKQSENSKVDNS